jgi:predicted amidohydrolase YtcJ
MFPVLLLATALSADPAVPAELVVVNGKVWTGDADKPEVQAFAVVAGKVFRVGTDDEVKKFVGKDTKVIDAGGKRVLPGFYDSHLHLLGGGLQLARVELKDCPDEAEFGKRLKEFDARTPSARWMLGGNWDHDRTFKGELPTAATLDKYVPNRPVFLRRYDGHMGLANTAALKLARITADTKDPAGGVIGRLADGKTPSGILKDNAMDLLGKLIPEPDEAEIREGVKAALAACAENGLTSVQDMEGNSPATRKKLFAVLKRMAENGQLTARIDLRYPIANQKEWGEQTGSTHGDKMFRFSGLKGFMDGSLGSSTAKMFAGYESDPNTTGVFVTKPDDMLALVKYADGLRTNVAVHAIGDEANARLLDIYAAVAKQNGDRDRRFRIEHAQHLRPEDYKRFKEIGVVASMQPFHMADDARWAEQRIGKKRCESSYAFRSLLDAGAVLAFGSDWPVAPLDVPAGIDAAVNRRPLDSKPDHPGWYPAQAITAAEAVRAYTWGGAYAAQQENERGTLAAGMQADFVVLSRDILAKAEQAKIGDTKVDLTAVGGKVVFERKR